MKGLCILALKTSGGSKLSKSYKLFLQIDQLPKSLNKKLNASSRWGRNRENKAWDNMMFVECRGKLPDKPLERANISFVRHFYRFLDFDNLVGSLKPVVDALVTAGVLVDDNWEVLGSWTVNQKFRSKSLGPLLEIIIQEMPTNMDQN